MTRKQPGALSTKEMLYIKDNINHSTPDEIADHLNRRVEAVRRYVHKEKLGPEFNKGITRNQTVTEVHQREILKALRLRPFYAELRKQLSSEELKNFDDNWTMLVADMQNDVLAAEELDLKELIILEILKGRLLEEFKIAQDERTLARQRMTHQLKLDKDLRDKEIMRNCKEMIANSQHLISNFNKDLNVLIDKSNKIKLALQQTRAQRTENLEKAAIDFKGYIKVLDDIKRKQQVGREMEIMRIAKEKKQKELSNYYTFQDGTPDRPILNAETVE